MNKKYLIFSFIFSCIFVASNSLALAANVIDGACGTTAVNGITTGSLNLCSAGLPDAFAKISVTNSANWICLGQNGGKNVSCATPTTSKINGVCGATAYNGIISEVLNLCFIGLPDSLVKIPSTNSATWTCLGQNGGNNANCSTPVVAKINGVCGATAVKGITNEALDLCTAGLSDAFIKTDSNSATWSCLGRNGGTNASCTTPVINKIDAVCGSSHEQFFFSAPTENLCAAGNPSPVSGPGGWSWVCGGVNGGKAAFCSAYKKFIISTAPKAETETTNEEPDSTTCVQVTTFVRNTITNECRELATPCDIPSSEWVKVDSCSTTNLQTAGNPVDSSLSYDYSAQTFGSITLEKPLNQMSRDELLRTLVVVLQSLISRK